MNLVGSLHIHFKSSPEDTFDIFLERERNIDRLPLVGTLTWYQTHNLVVHGRMLQPPEPPGQGALAASSHHPGSVESQTYYPCWGTEWMGFGDALCLWGVYWG